jgi:hypothetical protein
MRQHFMLYLVLLFRNTQKSECCYDYESSSKTFSTTTVFLLDFFMHYKEKTLYSNYIISKIEFTCLNHANLVNLRVSDDSSSSSEAKSITSALLCSMVVVVLSNCILCTTSIWILGTGAESSNRPHLSQTVIRFVAGVLTHFTESLLRALSTLIIELSIFIRLP